MMQHVDQRKMLRAKICEHDNPPYADPGRQLRQDYGSTAAYRMLHGIYVPRGADEMVATLAADLFAHPLTLAVA